MGTLYLLIRGFDNLILTSKSNWDRTGKSVVSIDEAIDDAVQDLIRRDILEYHLKPRKQFFRETTAAEIVGTSVVLRKPTLYQIKLRAAKKKAKGL